MKAPDMAGAKARAERMLATIRAPGYDAVADGIDADDAAALAEDVLALGKELERVQHPLQGGTFTDGRLSRLVLYSDDPEDTPYWYRVELDEHGLVEVAEEDISSTSPDARPVGIRAIIDLTRERARWLHGALGTLLGLKEAP